MSDIFRFKQFSIDQSNAPFKIGTDGLLLGAWADGVTAKHILDIGCGTGLIGLMLAQRYPQAIIKGIDINKNAAEIAANNFSNSPWANRLEAINQSLPDVNPNSKFDLIVSNPPYFSHSKLSENEEKNLARHTNSLSYKTLIEKAAELLSPEGRVALVLPIDILDDVLRLSKTNELHLTKQCSVFPTPQKPAKRVLVEFSATPTKTLYEELIIEEFGRHQYSKNYLSLTQAFLLNS